MATSIPSWRGSSRWRAQGQSPDWRWFRADSLIATKRNFSTKRDDQATGIAITYLRELQRCRSARRLARIQAEFPHVSLAHQIWLASGVQRLELEARILARQSDIAIALEMGLPPETVQAYADLFFDVRGRIDAATYIVRQAIGIPAERAPSTPRELLLMSAYFHGPEVIEPWLCFIKGAQVPDNSLPESQVTIANLVKAHSTDITGLAARTSAAVLTNLPQNQQKFDGAGTTASAFAKTTATIANNLMLPAAELQPLSYRQRPLAPKEGRSASKIAKDRQAA